MAGIKCGRCGEEINHHGEPNGIELILFSAELLRLCSRGLAHTFSKTAV